MSRYVAQPRPQWEPPRFVVVDGATGLVLSRHAAEAEAQGAAEAMNRKPR